MDPPSFKGASIRRALRHDGYVVIPNLVDLAGHTDSEYFTRARYAKAIFNNKGKNDRMRLLIGVSPPPEHLKVYTTLMRCISPELRMKQPAVIKSKPGCVQQFWHTDYPPGMVQELPENLRPCTLLVSLSPEGAELPLMDRSQMPQCIKLNQGDGVVFAGDLPHAGASYEKLNLRFHVYFDTPAFERPMDMTWPIRPKS